MASAATKTNCLTCGKARTTYDCKGCQQPFCLNHLVEHQKATGQQLDDIEHQRNILKQTINHFQANSPGHPLIQKIDQWEQDSIRIIQQTAKESRDIVNKFMNGHVQQLNMKLNKLTDQMKELRNENDFNENDLKSLKIELDELQKQFNQPKYIEIKDDSTLIKKINVDICFSKRPNFSIDIQWNPHAVTIAGQNENGRELNQFNDSCGIDIDHNQTIYVADFGNDRIVEWKKDAIKGRIVAGGNGRGTQLNQLKNPVDILIDYGNDALIVSDYGNRRVVRWPRQNSQCGEIIISNIKCFGLAFNKYGDLYVADQEKHEVRRWKIGSTEATLVAGGNGAGDRLNQLNLPRFVHVDENESVYVSDCGNHRVMKWVKNAQEGIVVAGGHGEGNSLSQLSYNSDVFVDQFDTVYVADCWNHRVMRWLKGSETGEIVAAVDGRGSKSSQLNKPTSFTFDEEKSLYVIDSENQRVQKFSILEKK